VTLIDSGFWWLLEEIFMEVWRQHGLSLHFKFYSVNWLLPFCDHYCKMSTAMCINCFLVSLYVHLLKAYLHCVICALENLLFGVETENHIFFLLHKINKHLPLISFNSLKKKFIGNVVHAFYIMMQVDNQEHLRYWLYWMQLLQTCRFGNNIYVFEVQ